jgi:hypothetical protein
MLIHDILGSIKFEASAVEYVVHVFASPETGGALIRLSTDRPRRCRSELWQWCSDGPARTRVPPEDILHDSEMATAFWRFVCDAGIVVPYVLK